VGEQSKETIITKFLESLKIRIYRCKLNFNNYSNNNNYLNNNNNNNSRFSISYNINSNNNLLTINNQINRINYSARRVKNNSIMTIIIKNTMIQKKKRLNNV
jgi:hypothetical protein